jgi:hypothetical protein
MGVKKVTTITYGCVIKYNDLKQFALDNIEGTSPDDWFDSFTIWFEEEFKMDFLEFSDGPLDGDDNTYLGIKKRCEIGTFKLNPKEFIDKYNSVFTSEVKLKLYPLIKDQKEEFYVRTFYK